MHKGRKRSVDEPRDANIRAESLWRDRNEPGSQRSDCAELCSGALSAHPETGELNVLPEEERLCLFCKLDETQNKQRDDSKVVLFILENTLRLLAGLQSKQLFLFQQTGPFFFLNKFQSDGRGDGVLLATNSTLHVRRRTISAVALLQQYVCCPVMLQQRRVNDANKINHKQSSPSESCAAERCLNEVVKKRCTGRKSPPVSIPPPRRCC